MKQTTLCPPASPSLRVVCFGSGSGSTLEALVKEQRRQELSGPPHFIIQAVVVNKPCRCIEVAHHNNIPCIVLNRKTFFSDNISSARDSATAHRYDEAILRELNHVTANPGTTIDLIALTGYSSIVTKPLLRAFPDRIINSHPADLSLLNKAGERIYAGFYGPAAIRQALMNGDRATKTCIHLVTEQVDAGEILVTSKPLMFSPELFSMHSLMPEKLLQENNTMLIHQHQEEQKKTCDIPAYLTALEYLAAGRLSVGEMNNGRAIFLDGTLLPYEGINLEHRHE